MTLLAQDQPSHTARTYTVVPAQRLLLLRVLRPHRATLSPPAPTPAGSSAAGSSRRGTRPSLPLSPLLSPAPNTCLRQHRPSSPSGRAGARDRAGTWMMGHLNGSALPLTKNSSECPCPSLGGLLALSSPPPSAPSPPPPPPDGRALLGVGRWMSAASPSSSSPLSLPTVPLPLCSLGCPESCLLGGLSGTPARAP
eukprot:1288963-Rhodomonas_salina.1